MIFISDLSRLSWNVGQDPSRFPEGYQHRLHTEAAGPARAASPFQAARNGRVTPAPPRVTFFAGHGDFWSFLIGSGPATDNYGRGPWPRPGGRPSFGRGAVPGTFGCGRPVPARKARGFDPTCWPGCGHSCFAAEIDSLLLPSSLSLCRFAGHRHRPLPGILTARWSGCPPPKSCRPRPVDVHNPGPSVSHLAVTFTSGCPGGTWAEPLVVDGDTTKHFLPRASVAPHSLAGQVCPSSRSSEPRPDFLPPV